MTIGDTHAYHLDDGVDDDDLDDEDEDEFDDDNDRDDDDDEEDDDEEEEEDTVTTAAHEHAFCLPSLIWLRRYAMRQMFLAHDIIEARKYCRISPNHDEEEEEEGNDIFARMPSSIFSYTRGTPAMKK